MSHRWLVPAALFLLFGACAPRKYVVHSTPLSPSVRPSDPYPTEASYELLGIVKGTACGEMDQLDEADAGAAIPGDRESNFGHPYLYQSAKFQALESSNEADNLTSIRVAVETTGERQCVTVAGRAYKLKSLSSTPPPGSGSVGSYGFQMGTGLFGSIGGTEAEASARASLEGDGFGLQVGPVIDVQDRGAQALILLARQTPEFEIGAELGLGDYTSIGLSSNGRIVVGAFPFVTPYVSLGGVATLIPDAPLAGIGARIGVGASIDLSSVALPIRPELRFVFEATPLHIGEGVRGVFDDVTLGFMVAMGATWITD